MPAYVTKTGKDDLNAGRYITVSRDGIICFWSLTLKLGAVHKVDAPPPRTKDIWITDACYIPSAHYMGLSTTARDILFYEVTTNGRRFNRLSRIVGLETCASRLSYWDGGLSRQSILIFGDCRGGVGAVTFTKPPQLTVLNIKGKNKKNAPEYYSLALAKIIKGAVDGLSGMYFAQTIISSITVLPKINVSWQVVHFLPSFWIRYHSPSHVTNLTFLQFQLLQILK